MRALSKLIFAVAMIFASAVSSATVLDVGNWGGSGCCDFGTRGYWFTAPEDFTITSVYLPNGQVQNSTLQVLRFNSPVPTFSGVTNDFVSLGYWQNVASVATSISVHANDIIGLLGWADGFTPYRNATGNYATVLDGQNISLQRLGFQFLGQAHDVWTEVGTIGVVGMTYETTAQVPEPSVLLLVALGLVALALPRLRAPKV